MDTTPALFQAWYESRKQLADSIQCYYDASLALENSITTRSSSCFERGALDTLYDTIYTDLEHLFSRKNKLNTAGAMLKRILNRNIEFVPIRTLPDEVLVHIFLPLTRGWCNFFPTSERPIEECEITKTTVRLTHVCADWRRLAISTPSLWSHLDMVDNRYVSTRGGGLRNRLKSLWLERSGNTPLALQISVKYGTGENYEDGELTEMVSHFGKIRSLGIQAADYTTHLTVLEYWAKNGGIPSALKEFFTAGRKKSYGDPWDGRGSSLLGPVLADCLNVLQVLRVRNMSFLFDAFIFRLGCPLQLTHLEFIDLPSFSCSSSWFLVYALGLCPKLQVLKLESLKPQDNGYSPENKPISFPALERLELIDVCSDLCSLLLSQIHPGPGELSLRLENLANSNADALRSFLPRANITKLYIKPDYNWISVARVLTTIPNLRTLALDLKIHNDRYSRDECDSILEEFMPIPGSGDTCWWPELDVLWLIEGKINGSWLKKNLQARRVKTLILSLADIQDQEPGTWELVQHGILESRLLPNRVVDEWYKRC